MEHEASHVSYGNKSREESTVTNGHDVPHPVDGKVQAIIDRMSPASQAFAEAAIAAGLRVYAKWDEVAVDIPSEVASASSAMSGSITVYGSNRSGWYGYWYPKWPETAAQRGFNLCSALPLSVDGIIDSARTCDRCGKVVPFSDLRRYSFAGGGCLDCIDALRKEHEYPGWYN